MYTVHVHVDTCSNKVSLIKQLQLATLVMPCAKQYMYMYVLYMYTVCVLYMYTVCVLYMYTVCVMYMHTVCVMYMYMYMWLDQPPREWLEQHCSSVDVGYDVHVLYNKIIITCTCSTCYMYIYINYFEVKLLREKDYFLLFIILLGSKNKDQYNTTLYETKPKQKCFINRTLS